MGRDSRFRTALLAAILVVLPLTLLACSPIAAPPPAAPVPDPPAPGVSPGLGERYEIGTVDVADVWVDPVGGF